MRIHEGKIVINDSRGNPSVTLPLVYASFCVIQFIMIAQLFTDAVSMNGVDYAAAMAACGGIWLWREGQVRK